VKDEPFADQVRVVVENRSPQEQKALFIDEDLRAIGTLEHLVAEARFLVPRKRVAQTRAATGLDADTKTTLSEALTRHQRANPGRRGLRNLNAAFCWHGHR